MSQRHAARFGVVSDFTDLNLHRACANGDVGLVKYALTHGQPVNSVVSGVLPIHAAASSGNDTVVRMLIEAGADVNAPRLSRRHTHNHAKTSGLAIGTAGSTPLHFAAANNHLSTITLLLSFGARASATEKHGLTPEAIAAQKGFDRAADLLRDATGPSPVAGPSGSIVRRSSAASASSSGTAGASSGGGNGHHQARRRPSLPALMERAAHPGASLHAAIGRVRRDSDALRTAVKEARGAGAGHSAGLGVEEDEGEDDRSRRRRSADGPRGPRATSGSRAEVEEAPMSAPATRTTFSAADLARSSSNMTLGSQVGSSSSLAQAFYRPRQSSQLSGRTHSSISGNGGPVSPRVFIDDDDDYTLEDEYSEGLTSNREDSTPSHSFKRAPSLLRSSFDPRHHHRQPSTASSVPSTGSENPTMTDPSDSSAPPSLSGTATGTAHQLSTGSSTPARLRGFVTQSRTASVDQDGAAQSASGRTLVATRSHRSDSTGTDGRFSQSSATSSYSGPGTGSTYAPSASTVGTSVTGTSPKPQATPLGGRAGLGLTPLYEAGGQAPRHPSPSRASASTGSSGITTSAEAHSKVKQAEQQLLAFDRKGGHVTAAGGMTLAQQLAAYGQSLSLERALAAREREAASKGYHLETIGTSARQHLATPTPSLTSQPSISKLSSSASTVLGTTPTPANPNLAVPVHTHPHPHHAPAPPTTGTPTWPPQDRHLRLAPPGQFERANGRRSVSPMGTSGPARRLPIGKEAGPVGVPAGKANSISSGSSSVTRSSVTPLTIPPPVVVAPGAAPFDLVVVSPASSASGERRVGRGSGEVRAVAVGGGGGGGGGSVTSGKDQVLLDAEERERVAGAVPRAVLTVPKKNRGLGGLFGRKK